MYISNLRARNFRLFGDGDRELNLTLKSGVTGLVGRNDSGKSAIIDAIRYALLTRDQNYVRVQPEDFHIDGSGRQADEICIRCQLTDLSDDEKGAFAEYLTYLDGEISLRINWTARRRGDPHSARRWVDVSVRSGVDGGGPTFEGSARELLASAYLRPLRDAAREMSSGRGSRLAQILASIPEITGGAEFDETALPADPDAVGKLSLLGLADYLRHSVKAHRGVSGAENSINKQYLSSLVLRGESLGARIDLTDGGSDAFRLRRILERLELGLFEASTSKSLGCYGLGSNNILYMACELLLLGREPDGLPLLLVEEPEAHLHPQRQLRLMDFLSSAAEGSIKDSPRAVQVILSTHSPNLASVIPLENLVVVEGGNAYPLAREETRLADGDYKFLERFLDVTKANLFFAHGVIIVEGDAEALLLPTLARLVGADLREHGVSVVNVGGTGLRRFSRIFQRSDLDATSFSTLVACVADMDVMPDCAPSILGLVSGDDDAKWTNPRRRWKARRHFGNKPEIIERKLMERRQRLCESDGQSVRTFVSDHWTLEYDLAFSGLAEEVYIAGRLAKNDAAILEGKIAADDVKQNARDRFKKLEKSFAADRAVLCSHVYKPFKSSRTSKAIAAQYLASALAAEGAKEGFDAGAFKRRLPPYIVEAIAYVTGTGERATGGESRSAVERRDG